MKRTRASGAVAFGLVIFVWSCSSDDAAGAGKPDSSTSWTGCKTDTECPVGQGCETSSGSDGYCAPLCSAPQDCPKGYDCPGLVLGAPGSCAEVGAHAGDKGVCDLFAGSNGPNSCITGSGDAGAQDGGGKLDCQGMCEHRLAAGCSKSPTLEYCVTDCEQWYGQWSALCPSQLQAYSDCIKAAEFSCAPDGTRSYNGSCGVAANEISKCVGCKVAATDEACGTCLKQKCCDTLTQANFAPNVIPYEQCVELCTNLACKSECATLYPEAAAAIKAHYECGTTQCVSECL